MVTQDSILRVLELLQQLKDTAPFVDQIEWELRSIKKFYQIKLSQIASDEVD